MQRGRRSKRLWDAVPSALLVGIVVGLSLASAACNQSTEPPKVAIQAVPANSNAEGGTSNARQHPLVPLLKLARASRDSIATARDYEAVFTKRELLGRTMNASQMALKLRADPFSVYLRFIDKNNGREVLYVEGANNGKLLAHDAPGSLKAMLGTISLDPTGSLALDGGRHPITEIGMQKLVGNLIRQWEGETKYDEVECQFFPDAKLIGPVENIPCQVAESTHPEHRPYFRFHRSRLYVEKKTNFPVRLEQWGFPEHAGADPPLLEEYTYTDVKTNLGLTKSDFDVHNRNYKF